MSTFHSDFQNNYKELFKNVETLNQYTRLHQAELTNAKVEDFVLYGAEFTGAKFNGVIWENAKLEKSTFIRAIFEDCKFRNASMDDSKFVDCVFIGCEFEESSICASSLVKCQFIKCALKNSFMNQWTGDAVDFDQCKILDTPLAQGNIQFTFKKTDLDGVRIMMTEGLHPLLIEGGSLSEVDFGKSHFSTVTLRRVKQGEGPVRFNGATMEKITIEDVDLWRGLSLSEIKAGSVSVAGGRLKTSFSDSVIPKIYARNVEFYLFSLSESHLSFVSLTDCKIQDFPMWNGYVEELHLHNCAIDEIDGENFKADTVIWDNVTLEGKIDFTNAHIKDFQATRLKRGPQLQLITAGSNLMF